MKKILRFLSFIPFVDRLINKRLYACGFGTYIVNSISKRILGINKGPFLIHFTSRVNKPEKIKLIQNGKQTINLSFATSGGCYYQALNGIEIGEGTIWSYNCSFISSNHDYKDLSKHIKGNPIVIGEYVWIASNCVILPEVSIGKYTIVGAGSIVTKDIPPYSIAVGNPAKVIAKRCERCLEKKAINESCNSC